MNQRPEIFDSWIMPNGLIILEKIPSERMPAQVAIFMLSVVFGAGENLYGCLKTILDFSRLHPAIFQRHSASRIEIQFHFIISLLVKYTTGFEYLGIDPNIQSSDDFSGDENTHLLVQAIGIKNPDFSRRLNQIDLPTALQHSLFKRLPLEQVHHYVASIWSKPFTRILSHFRQHGDPEILHSVRRETSMEIRMYLWKYQCLVHFRNSSFRAIPTILEDRKLSNIERDAFNYLKLDPPSERIGNPYDKLDPGVKETVHYHRLAVAFSVLLTNSARRVGYIAIVRHLAVEVFGLQHFAQSTINRYQLMAQTTNLSFDDKVLLNEDEEEVRCMNAKWWIQVFDLASDKLDELEGQIKEKISFDGE